MMAPDGQGRRHAGDARACRAMPGLGERPAKTQKKQARKAEGAAVRQPGKRAAAGQAGGARRARRGRGRSPGPAQGLRAARRVQGPARLGA